MSDIAAQSGMALEPRIRGPAAEALRAVRKRSGLTVRAAADAMSMSPSTYSSYELTYKEDHLPYWLVSKLVGVFVGRGSPPLTDSEVKRLGAPIYIDDVLLRAPPRELPPMPEPPTQNARLDYSIDVPSRSTMPRDLPIYGTAAGSDGEGSFFINFGDVVDRAYRPPSLSKNARAYGIYVEGHSMAPIYEHGGLAIADPARKVRVGDRVVVVVVTGETESSERMAYIKEFVRETSDTLYLKQYNPPLNIEFPKRRVVPDSMHRLLTTAELMGVG